MQLQEFIKNQAIFYEQRIEKLSARLQGYPEGTYHCYRNTRGNNYIGYVTGADHKRTYIPKSNGQFEQRMAEKAALEAELQDTLAEYMACKEYLKALEENPADNLQHVMDNEGIRRVLLNEKSGRKKSGAKTKQPEDELLQWMQEPYQKNTKYQETLTVPTITGEMVRSKSEAMCVQLLYDLKIPFRYEQAHVLSGIEYFPDFTVLRPRDRRIFLVELFGMMDDRVYIGHAYSKLRIYADNGFIPEKNLLCFFETNENPLDISYVKKTFEHFLK